MWHLLCFEIYLLGGGDEMRVKGNVSEVIAAGSDQTIAAEE